MDMVVSLAAKQTERIQRLDKGTSALLHILQEAAGRVEKKQLAVDEIQSHTSLGEQSLASMTDGMRRIGSSSGQMLEIVEIIDGLISDNQAEIDSGLKNVEQTSDVVRRIVSNMNAIVEMMDELRHSSSQQK